MKPSLHRIEPRSLICADDSPFRHILDNLGRVARSRAPVLLMGESGTGKEGVARRLHSLAPWSAGPFIPVNCAAIPHSLLESELFGHVRGAFTGADKARVGRVEAASGGTLFLDEISDMPAELQVKLLRVLQEKTYVPLGASTPRHADFRVVAATNGDLDAAVDEGRFRQDLLFRLDVVRVELPPLRERPMDIAPLAAHFIAKHATSNDSLVDGITSAAMMLMHQHPWPGNVRELENIIQGVLVFKERGVIEPIDIARKIGGRGRGSAVAFARSTSPVHVRLPEEGLVLKEAIHQIERRLIEEALGRVGGNKARAASLLGLNRTTLVEKLKRHHAQLREAS